MNQGRDKSKNAVITETLNRLKAQRGLPYVEEAIKKGFGSGGNEEIVKRWLTTQKIAPILGWFLRVMGAIAIAVIAGLLVEALKK